MDGEAKTPGPTTPATGEASAPATDGPPQWFADYSAQADKRFAGLAEKISAYAPAPAPAAESKGKPSQSLTANDVEALISLGGSMTGLSDAQRESLAAMKASGMSIAHQAQVAQSYQQSASQADTQPANGVPPGIAANAAPSTALRFPTNISELRSLKESDPVAFQALADHPDFRPELLPNT
jgi:hypothetical protein